MSTAPPKLILPLLAAAAGVGLLASAIYTPSIPAIAKALETSTESVQLTMTGYLLAFAASMLLQGGLTDRFGRRKVLLGGMVLTLIGSLACALAPNIHVLMLARIVQAVGACAGAVVARVMVRDLYSLADAAKAMALVSGAISLAPLLAPLLGGELQVLFGWRAGFFFVTGFALILVCLAWRMLPEPNRPTGIQTGLLQGMATSYRTLLGTRRFIAYSLVIAAGAIGFYAFAVEAPVLLIHYMGVTPDHYGFYGAAPSAGFIAATLLSSRISDRIGVNAMVRVGSLMLPLGGLLMAALALTGVGGAMAVVGPMMLFSFSNGLGLPNAYASSLNIYPRIAGAAAALAGFLQISLGGAGSVVVTFLPGGSPLGLAGTLTGAGLMAALAWHFWGEAPLPPQ